MVKITFSKKGNKKSPIAAFSGAIVGAAVAAGAIFLSDKGNRKRLQRKMDEMMDVGEEKLNEAGKMLSGVSKSKVRSKTKRGTGSVSSKKSGVR